MTFDDLSQVKIVNIDIITLSVRDKGYFICNPSKYRTFVTKIDHSTIFYSLF